MLATATLECQIGISYSEKSVKGYQPRIKVHAGGVKGWKLVVVAELVVKSWK